MATDFDPYRILQLPPDATEDDIHAAYERLSTPGTGDGLTGEGAAAVDTAYRILSDPEQRSAYDQRRSEALARGYVQPQESAESLEALACPRCGVLAVADARFCGSCGQPLARRGAGAGAPWGPKDIVKAIGVIVVGLIVSGIPIYLAAEAIAGDKELEDDPNAWAVVLASNFVVQFLMFGSAYWFSVRKYRLDLRALGWRAPKRGGVLFTIGLVFAAFAMTMAWGILLQALGIEPDTDLPEQTYEDIRPIIALVILSMFLAPVCEETFFRGFVFGSLRWRWGVLLGALASGALFSVSHIGNPGYLVVLPSIIGIGMLFAWGYYWSDSLYPPIAAHLAFNSVSVIYSIAAA
jgi:membrane protease YdiL (CAAX protease family)